MGRIKNIALVEEDHMPVLKDYLAYLERQIP